MRARARGRRASRSARAVFDAANSVAPALDAEHLRRVALHEAGHVLMGHLYGMAPPERAALRGRGGEIVRREPELLTPTLADAMIRVFLAGRATEKMFFDEVSSGSGGPSRDSDLALATEMARRIELNFGFAGRLTWHDPATTLALQPRDIRDAVEARLRKAEAEVTSALAAHRDTLERIASVLFLERDLDRARLAELLQGVAPSEEDAPSDTPEPRAG